MTNIKPHNHLKDSFYTVPKLTRQLMTLEQWKETMLFTEGRILSCGETWELCHKYVGGGIHEVTVQLTYWKNGRPKKNAKGSVPS